MPAIPGMGGGARKGKQQQRKKGKSGNPAKRAAEEKAALERAAGARTAAANAAFGMPGSALGAGDRGRRGRRRRARPGQPRAAQGLREVPRPLSAAAGPRRPPDRCGLPGGACDGGPAAARLDRVGR